MDKHAINKFAVQARRDLITSVTSRLVQLGITETGAAEKEARSTAAAEYYAGTPAPLEGKAIQYRADLVKRLNELAAKNDWQTAYHDLIEEVAYTWFNRIIAIRFMEINDYLPSGTRVLSSLENRNEPDIMFDALDLEDALGGYSADDLALIQKAQELQQPTDLDAMYQMLFVKQVNKLHESLPKLFEKTDDFMSLLFTPSYNRGVIKNLVEQIPEADFDIASDDSQGQVEIIGWLYQYYNQEPKDVAFTKRNYSQSDIPAVTQLFTPDWIVKYLVENSVGRLWLNHLQAIGETRSLRDLAQDFHWQYFMPEAEQPDTVKIQIQTNNIALKYLKPEDITIIDPSMGSGHILIYAFDVLMQIYSTQGYSQREAAKAILAHNLFGLDIDMRAFQLAYFAMMMKGRQYNRRILRSEVTPNVFDVPSIHWTQDDLGLLTTEPQLLDSLKTINSLFSSGDELGSLISVDTNATTLEDLKHIVADTVNSGQLSLQSEHLSQLCHELDSVLKVLNLLTDQYQIGITNPPYMGSGKMPSKLATFVKKHYPSSKSDLFAVFMERMRELTIDHGYYAMITQHQWMFLSSFESLRKQLSQQTFVNLAHLGTRAFEEIGGEVVQSVAFVMQKVHFNAYVGTYERLVDFDSQSKKEQAYLETVHTPELKYVYRANQANFEKIPGSPIAYWASQNLIHDFEVGTPMSKIVDPRQGLATADNNRFLRQWYEVAIDTIKFDAHSIAESVESKRKWFPYNKGGAYRKWYGNYDYVVNWENNGQEIRNFTDSKGKVRSRPQNTNFYFREAITWSLLTSAQTNVRFREIGSIHDVNGMSAFGSYDELVVVMGLVNSVAGLKLMAALNPTLAFQVGDFQRLPLIDISRVTKDKLIDKVKSCVRIAKEDWNLSENSWPFLDTPLLSHIVEHNRNWTVEAAFNQWSKEAEDRFNQLKSNEEELNRIFIDLYGLQDELTPEVADKDVSVRKADRPRDIKAFLSYFVGVVFGRYSLDVPGLAFAGGEWNPSKYKTFLPNKDDIILLTDDDYFDDDRDIIHRLKEFLTVTFGAEHLDENLAYVADSLDKKGDTPEAQIRKYFMDDFYKKDHLSTYQKRPIYWQLTSGKNDGFKALMYLHRYDENTLAMIRTTYLHPLQEAYVNRRTQLAKMIEVESNTRQCNQMTKSVTRLDKQIDEIAKYDTSLQHVANMHIVLDLDDGVLVNHEKAQGGQKLLSPLK